MAETVAEAIAGGSHARSPAPTCPPSSSCSASTWPASATPSPTTPGALELTYADPITKVYKKLVVTADGKHLLGGDAGRRRLGVSDAAFAGRHGHRAAAQPGGADPAGAVRGAGRDRTGRAAGLGARSAPARTSTRARSCTRSPTAAARRCRRSRACTKAGTGCGSCVPLLKTLLEHELTKAGVTRQQGDLRALRLQPRRAVRHRQGDRGDELLRRAHLARHRPRLRPLQAGRRLDPGQPAQRARPRRRARVAAGHQRPPPGQHAAQRHLLGGAAHPRRRDHRPRA